MAENVRLVPPVAKGGSWYRSTAHEKSKLVLTGKGVVHSVLVHNKSGSTAYLFLHDGTDSTGTVMMAPVVIPTDANVSVDIPTGMAFDTGLFVSLSSSSSTYALIAGNDAWFTVGYAKSAQVGQ